MSEDFGHTLGIVELMADDIVKLREENERLKLEIERLNKYIAELHIVLKPIDIRKTLSSDNNKGVA